MMLPIFQLKPGQIIIPRMMINPTMAANWRYRTENADIGAGLTPAAELKIVEVNASIPGNHWIRVQIPGRNPPAYLKLWGEEVSRFNLKQ